jgi:hypothetical protein
LPHISRTQAFRFFSSISSDAARQGLERARKLKPDPFSRRIRQLITTGGFDNDLARIRERLDYQRRSGWT